MVSAVTLPGLSQTDSPVSKQMQSTQEEFARYLKILTTEVTHQDPTDPIKSSDMAQSFGTFAQLGIHLENSNKLDTLNAVANNIVGLMNKTYLNQVVEIPGAAFNLEPGIAPTLSYDLPVPADRVTIEIINENQETVRTLDGTTTKGKNSLLWDGLTKDQTSALPGKYTFRVIAKDKDNGPLRDEEGLAVKIPTFATSRVTGIERDEHGNTYLKLESLRVKAKDVSNIDLPILVQHKSELVETAASELEAEPHPLPPVTQPQEDHLQSDHVSET